MKKENIVIFLGSILFIILILEITIRIYDQIKGHSFFSNHRNLITKEIKPLRPFRTFGFELYKKDLYGNKFISSRHKELYPITKPRNTFRIVVFGGSTSENLSSFKKTKLHYPLIIEKKLKRIFNPVNIEVINVANSAYATPHSLILLELDVISWKPDMIIVSHNVNDLLASYWPDFTFNYSNKYNNKFYSIPDYKSIFTLTNIIFQNSQLYWIIRDRISKLKKSNQSNLKRKSYGYTPPKLAIEVFERNLNSIITIAKSNKIKVLIANQPLQSSQEYFEKHMKNKSYNSTITYPLHSEFINHHKLFNSILINTAIKNEVMYIDNDSIFKNNKKYFIDFVHYTPAGVQKIANNYLNYLQLNYSHLLQKNK